jgi:hypothetical protein
MLALDLSEDGTVVGCGEAFPTTRLEVTQRNMATTALNRDVVTYPISLNRLKKVATNPRIAGSH